MTYKLEPWSISKSLHLLLDLYERDPSIPHILLSSELNPFGAFDDDLGRVPLAEQFELLKQTSKNLQEEIRRKTLIETQGLEIRHRVIRDYLHRPEKVPPLYADPDTRRDRDSTIAELEEEWAAERGLSYAEYKGSCVREKLTEKKVEAELLRFFADRIEALANAIEQFDDTRFDLLIPESLAMPFRELHINAVLGNYGTACILCGALLERTLQDLIPSTSLLNELIKEAKTDGLLSGHNKRYADRIRDDRNNVVHGRVEFGSISADHALETLSCTRKLISALYKGRLSEEH